VYIRGYNLKEDALVPGKKTRSLYVKYARVYASKDDED
jgi:hypothetical protein